MSSTFLVESYEWRWRVVGIFVKGVGLLLTTNMVEFVRPAVFTSLRCWVVQVKVKVATWGWGEKESTIAVAIFSLRDSQTLRVPRRPSPQCFSSRRHPTSPVFVSSRWLQNCCSCLQRKPLCGGHGTWCLCRHRDSFCLPLHPVPKNVVSFFLYFYLSLIIFCFPYLFF